jgi:hypothetical protein
VHPSSWPSRLPFGSPQAIDPAQDVGKQRSWHRHLSELEHHVAAMAHDAGADLDQLLAQEVGKVVNIGERVPGYAGCSGKSGVRLDCQV